MSVEAFQTCNKEQQEILKYWFGPEYPNKIPEEQGRIWSVGAPEVNAEIIVKFKSLVNQAVEHKLDHWWSQGPHQCLALIILLDQFSMNIGRERKDAYGFIASAQSVPFAYAAIGRGYPEMLLRQCLLFFFLPLMHSENMPDQAKCMEMHRKFGMSLPFAQRHYDAVAQFGRYPNRNAAHGRQSTPEEEEYLKTFTGWSG